MPTASATLPGARAAYARVAHSDLTRDPLVAAAVVDLLRRVAPSDWRRACAAPAAPACASATAQLQRTHVEKVDWAALAPEQRRLFLQNLNEPPHLKLRVPRARRRRR